MGTSIHYELETTTRSESKARQIVERIRQRAMDLAFERVSEVVELVGRDCDPRTYDPDDGLEDLPIRCLKLVPVGTREVEHGLRMDLLT